VVAIQARLFLRRDKDAFAFMVRNVETLSSAGKMLKAFSAFTVTLKICAQQQKSED
jgi:hypothetical protein